MYMHAQSFIRFDLSGQHSLLTQARPLGLNVTSLPDLHKCLQSGCLSVAVSESHIRPYCPLPAPQASGLPLLGQNTAGQEL